MWRPAGCPDSIEWVPCARTAQQCKDIDPFLSDISSKGTPIKHFLGFNEPEHPGQANMKVEDAVRLWREMILPAKKKFGFRLGSPGMTSDVSKCRPWLDSFFQQLGGDDEIDFLVVHWYGPKFQDFRAYVEDMHNAYKLPVWVNEFACSKMGAGQASADEVEAFIKEAVEWLDQCEWVERYAYFGNAQGRDVGEWVGKSSNFTEPAEGSSSARTDGRTLSRIGNLYCQC